MAVHRHHDYSYYNYYCCCYCCFLAAASLLLYLTKDAEAGSPSSSSSSLPQFALSSSHTYSRGDPNFLRDARVKDVARLQGFRKTAAVSPLGLDVSEPSYSTGVVGGGVGQYMADFLMGTPAQKLRLIVDTGSDLTWVRCAKRNPGGFVSARSSTYTPIPCSARECLLVPPPARRHVCHGAAACRYEYTYADLSDTSGVFARETAVLGNGTRLPGVAFGCGLKNAGRSFSGADGVLALGRGVLSFTAQAGTAMGNKFSYCLPDFFQRAPTHSSYLTFGESEMSLDLQYTPLQKNPFAQSLYYVGVEEVRVNGKTLPIPLDVWEVDPAGNGGLVLDSGTTLTFFREPAYAMILSAMKDALGYPLIPPPDPAFELCFEAGGAATAAPANALPQLSLLFKGGSWFEPPPANYFMDVAVGGNAYAVKCLGFQSVSSPFGFSVLGNLVQQNIFVEYDWGNGRLGFAHASCSG